MSVGAPWLAAADESGARRVALAPLALAGAAYASLARLHRAAYRRGLRRAAQLDCRVVSVGSLLVGGSGKTPLTAWLALALRRRGHNVVIASRGYGRLGREPVLVVSDGSRLHSHARQAGDEPMLLAARAPGVPVLVGRDRAVVGLRAVSAFGAQVLVLDDGFQHHRLAREVEILTFDGGVGLGNGHVLPRGPLREGIGALRYADAVGVVDGPVAEPDEQRIRRAAPWALRFAAARKPLGLRPLAGGPAQPLCTLADAEVGLLAGIARPDAFRRTVEALGAHVVAERLRPDHHRYRASDLRGLAREAPLWITTEKDAVKLQPSWADGADLRVLPVALEVEDPARLIDWLEARLR